MTGPGEVAPEGDGSGTGESEGDPEASARSVIEGRVTGSGAAVMGAEGSAGGSAADASAVEVYDATDAGLELVGSAAVAADGQFSVEVPAAATGLIVVAIDPDAQAIAQGIVDRAAAAGEVVFAPPLNLETTVEAEVFLEMVDCDCVVDTVDLRARIDEQLAAALAASTETGASGEAQVSALAQAVAAAQATELAAYALAGVDIDSEALMQAGLAASLALSADLHAGVDSAEATEIFLSRLDAAIATTVGVEAHARAELAAALAFGSVGEASLEGEAAIDAALSASVAAHAETVVAAARELLAEHGASAEVLVELDVLIEAGLDASANLEDARAYLERALDICFGADGVFAKLASELDMGADVDAELLGDSLDLSAAGSAELDAAIDAAVAAAVAPGTCVDADLVADVVVEAVAGYELELERELSGLGMEAGVGVSAMTDVLVLIDALAAL